MYTMLFNTQFYNCNLELSTVSFFRSLMKSFKSNKINLLAVWQRFEMVRISGNSSSWRLNTFRRSTIQQKQFVFIIIIKWLLSYINVMKIKDYKIAIKRRNYVKSRKIVISTNGRKVLMTNLCMYCFSETVDLQPSAVINLNFYT